MANSRSGSSGGLEGQRGRPLVGDGGFFGLRFQSFGAHGQSFRIRIAMMEKAESAAKASPTSDAWTTGSVGVKAHSRARAHAARASRRPRVVAT
jgi:hypothetical protein